MHSRKNFTKVEIDGDIQKKGRGLILAGRQEVVLGLSPSVRYFEKPKAKL
jgi:hypothetical protein